MTGPLKDLRVIEVGAMGPAPFCAMVLADLGATVLRIDRPRTGGEWPAAATVDTEPRRNAWDVLNRNRTGVSVDLRAAGGSEFVAELAAASDVLIEGFRPGVAERLGLGPDDLTGRHPGLVYGRMTGWGQDGPLAARVGHDLNYLALSGVLAHVGRADQPPTPPLNLVADFGGGGMLLAVGVLAALVERATSGRGQVVDAAMVDGAALLMAPLFGAWASGFWNEARGTNLLDSGAPFYDVYECSGGGWLAVGAIEPQFYAELLDGLDLADDPTLPDQNDVDRWPELHDRLASVIRTRTRDDWAATFEGRDACVSPVLTMAEAPEHPHAVARGSFPRVDGVAQPAPAPRFSRSVPPDPEPSLEGIHPAVALAPWGVELDRVEQLRSQGILD